MAGPNGRLQTFQEHRTLPGPAGPHPVPPIRTPLDLERTGEKLVGQAGGEGGPPGPSPPNANGPSPYEAPPAPPDPTSLSKPQRARINARRERRRGLLFVRLSQACLRRRLRAPIDQACGKIPPPGLPLWPRCQAAPGVTAPRRALPPAVGTRLRDGSGSQRGGLPDFANKNTGLPMKFEFLINE